MLMVKTRLPSNLRPITYKCMHFVTCGHFQSQDKDGGHNNWSTYPKTPCCMQTWWLYI